MYVSKILSLSIVSVSQSNLFPLWCVVVTILVILFAAFNRRDMYSSDFIVLFSITKLSILEHGIMFASNAAAVFNCTLCFA